MIFFFFIIRFFSVQPKEKISLDPVTAHQQHLQRVRQLMWNLFFDTWVNLSPFSQRLRERRVSVSTFLIDLKLNFLKLPQHTEMEKKLIQSSEQNVLIKKDHKFKLTLSPDLFVSSQIWPRPKSNCIERHFCKPAESPYIY